MAETSEYLNVVLAPVGQDGHNAYRKNNQKKHKNQKHQFIALNVRGESQHAVVASATLSWHQQKTAKRSALWHRLLRRHSTASFFRNSLLFMAPMFYDGTTGTQPLQAGGVFLGAPGVSKYLERMS